METTLQSITVSSSLTVITSVDSPSCACGESPEDLSTSMSDDLEKGERPPARVPLESLLAQLKIRVSDVVANTKVAEKVAGVLANENGKLLNEVREKLNFLDDAAEWQNEVLGEVENWTKIWDSRIGKILINRHDATLAENAMVIANLTESIEYARNFVYLKRNWMKEAVRSTQFEKCRHYVESLLSNGSDSEALSSVHSQRPTDYVIRRGAPILQSKEELSRGLQGPRQELTVLREAKIKGQASLARLVKWEEDLQNAGLRVKQAIADRKTEINELEHHLIAATYVLDQMRYYK